MIRIHIQEREREQSEGKRSVVVLLGSCSLASSRRFLCRDRGESKVGVNSEKEYLSAEEFDHRHRKDASLLLKE